jgi:ACS family tartrate transporter-like MFS transporter
MTTTGTNASASVSADIEARVVRTLLLRLMPFLFVLYIVNYLDRINVGFAALQMRVQLGFSDKVFGTAFGIFFLGYLCLQLPSNLLMARVGARRWMAAIMIAWGLISCLMIFVRTPKSFYELRFLLGAAEAGFFPGIILYMKNWFPATARARAVALFMTANPLAGMIGGPISGALLGIHQLGLAGWQWMFLLEGVPAVVLAGVVLVTLHDVPDSATWLTAEQKLWLRETLQRERDQHAMVSRRDVWGTTLKLSWQILLLTVVYFGLTASAYGVILWLPTYIHSLTSLSNGGIGFVSVIPYIASAVAMVLVGMSSDRTAKHRLHLAGSALSGAVFLLVAAYTTSIIPGLTFLTLALMATLCMQGPFWATATSLMSGMAAAAGIAVINSLGNLGGFFGPYIIGQKRSSGAGFRGGMLLIAATLALAAIISLLVRNPQRDSSPNALNPLQ